MGKHYSKEELERIQTLVTEGRTNREIASQLARPEAGIRNLRHRIKLEAETKDSLHSLLQEKKTLTNQLSKLRRQVQTLQARRDDISKILHTEEEALKQRLTSALTRLKDHKPELFHISIEEQIGKIAAQLTATFLKWLVS